MYMIQIYHTQLLVLLFLFKNICMYIFLVQHIWSMIKINPIYTAIDMWNWHIHVSCFIYRILWMCMCVYVVTWQSQSVEPRKIDKNWIVDKSFNCKIMMYVLLCFVYRDIFIKSLLYKYEHLQQQQKIQ